MPRTVIKTKTSTTWFTLGIEEIVMVFNATPVSEASSEYQIGVSGKTGIEPATSGVTDQHSNLLSYIPTYEAYCLNVSFGEDSAFTRREI